MSKTYIAVVTRIHDTTGWAKAMVENTEFPPGFDLKLFSETEDHRLAYSLWEGEGTQEDLLAFLNADIGHVSTNEASLARVSVADDLDFTPMDTDLFGR